LYLSRDNRYMKKYFLICGNPEVIINYDSRTLLQLCTKVTTVENDSLNIQIII